MAKRIYKAKDKLVQRRVRGAMVKENVRTKKRRRVGKKDVELDVNMARGPDDGIDTLDGVLEEGKPAPSRTKAGKRDVSRFDHDEEVESRPHRQGRSQSHQLVRGREAIEETEEVESLRETDEPLESRVADTPSRSRSQRRQAIRAAGDAALSERSSRFKYRSDDLRDRSARDTGDKKREQRRNANRLRYDSVYKGTLEPGMTLDSLYTKFNVERPEDFKGHSLSVSDVIVVSDEHGKTAWFVDSFGFNQLPDFFTQQEQQHEVPVEGEKTYPPVYRRTADYAREAGERDEYRASYQENIKCKQAIEKAISLDYDGQYLNDNAIFTVLDAFGPERLSWVLGNTITMKEHDGRFSRSNKAWAQAMSIPIDRDGFGSLRNWSYTVESHPAILDLYTTLLRKELERPPQERTAEKSVAREESKPRLEPSKPVKRKSEPSL